MPVAETEPVVLAAHGVNTYLGDQQILFNIDLELRAGQVVALLGGNGSGKTTLLRTLLGLVAHQGGSVELFDTPLERFRSWSRIGYVPQRGRLQMPNATVHEIVAMGLASNRRWFSPLSRAQRTAIDDTLERVGVSGRAQLPMAALSGGQQQRVMIARALVSESSLMLLDEPLSALDVRAQASLGQLLTQLNQDGVSMLIVLHELGPIESLLTRSVVLRHGRKIFDGALLSSSQGHSHHDAEPALPPLLAPTLGPRQRDSD